MNTVFEAKKRRFEKMLQLSKPLSWKTMKCTMELRKVKPCVVADVTVTYDNGHRAHKAVVILDKGQSIEEIIAEVARRIENQTPTDKK